MHKIVFIAFIGLIGCSQPTHIDSFTNIYSFDFSEYSSKGFYFYEHCFNGDYVLLSDIIIEYFPEGQLYDLPGADRDALYDRRTSQKAWYFKKIDYSMILEKVYQEALKYGANAFMNFEYEYIEEVVENVRVKGVRVSGSAIKIEN